MRIFLVWHRRNINDRYQSSCTKSQVVSLTVRLEDPFVMRLIIRWGIIGIIDRWNTTWPCRLMKSDVWLAGHFGRRKFQSIRAFSTDDNVEGSREGFSRNARCRGRYDRELLPSPMNEMENVGMITEYIYIYVYIHTYIIIFNGMFHSPPHCRILAGNFRWPGGIFIFHGSEKWKFRRRSVAREKIFINHLWTSDIIYSVHIRGSTLNWHITRETPVFAGRAAVLFLLLSLSKISSSKLEQLGSEETNRPNHPPKWSLPSQRERKLFGKEITIVGLCFT